VGHVSVCVSAPEVPAANREASNFCRRGWVFQSTTTGVVGVVPFSFDDMSSCIRKVYIDTIRRCMCRRTSEEVNPWLVSRVVVCSSFVSWGDLTQGQWFFVELCSWADLEIRLSNTGRCRSKSGFIKSICVACVSLVSLRSKVSGD
jgi:hypothetical protein